MPDGVAREPEIDLVGSLITYRGLLAEHQRALNVMNVFPVADSDTGTNMLRTVDAVVELLDPTMVGKELVAAVGRGALEGRGNSGLLLGQYLRGFTSGLLDDNLRSAFGHGAALARKAVSSPVEGTFLSVADAAAQCSDGEVVALIADARGRASAALARTPLQLPVLADAGVLDSGGAGLCLFFDALWETVSGLSASGLEPAGLVATEWPEPRNDEPELADHGPGFELQFSVNGVDRAMLMDALEGIGQSVVVAETGDVLLAHVHVTSIGPAIVDLADVLGGVPSSLEVEPLLASGPEQ